MKKGILLIHGFTGCQNDFSFLTPNLPKEYILEKVSLKGHQKLKLRKISYEDWIEDGLKGYENLANKCDEITIIGHSMGCIIASHIMILKENKVKKAIFFNPAFKHVSNFQFLISLPRIMREIPNNFYYDRRYFRNFKKVFTPRHAIKQLRKIAKISLSNITKIKQDVLIIQGKKDGLVKKKYSQFVIDEIHHDKKEIVLFKYWHNPNVARNKVKKQILEKVNLFI